MGGLHRTTSRYQVSQQPRRAAQQRLRQRAGRRGVQHRHLAWRAFVQQRRHGLDMGVGHTPTLRHAIQQHIGQRHNTHALVVRHEGRHRRKGFIARLACAGEVEGFNKAQCAAGRQRLQRGQIGDRAVRRYLGCQRSRVGRNNQLLRWRAPQCQPRHPLGRILVGQCMVAAGIRGLGDSPRYRLGARERYLLLQRCRAGFAQDAAVRLIEHQRRHQILEHRPRPRAQASRSTDRVERPTQRRPVTHWHVALGNRQQTGQTRFRSQQVVKTGVQMVFGDPVANVQQMPLAVVQEAEICLPGKSVATLRQGVQTRGAVTRCRNRATIPGS